MIQPKDARIGQTVYYYESWSDLVGKAQIVEIFTGNPVYYNVKCLTSVGSMDVLPENVYTTEQACQDAVNEENNRRAEQYAREIKTVEDLVRFPMKYNVGYAEEYTNTAAQKAYTAKVKEFLGISLD